QSILMASIPQTYFTLLSLAQLAIRGLTEDAQTCARKVFETMIHIMYINHTEEEKDKRAKQFLAFGTLKNYSQLKQVQKHPKYYSDEIRDWYSENEVLLKENYQRDKVLFEQNAKGEVLRDYFRSWTGKNFMEMMVDVKQDSAIVRYAMYCGSVHFSVYDIICHIDQENGVVRTGQNQTVVPYLLHEGGRIGGQIIEFASNEFDLDLKGRLKEIGKMGAELDRELRERAEAE
ncbi:MAG: DUF5677 domain-containing protein, partial [bacterium]|nr:DUF5677 domain-containing protein [bacterium]